MQMAPHIEALQSDLAEIAAIGDEATAQAAQRLSLALRSSVGLRILDALTEAALELSAQIPTGHVEVRLAGQDPSLVFVAEQEAEPAAAADDDQSARITLRLPESLKARLDAAAAREGVSVNTWLVRAISRAVSSHRPSVRVGNRLSGFGRS
jgi:predicted DNA binding CopG/RHH family protein